ncbi:MAG: ATP-dependent sacrificial sulfur transferase LarE [Candidatus Omnitrophica bacterium]|nr:ATP-dependent sacrificial sulfur transferase LarE [Candidatus Omnitrophota bacterium]
MQLAKKLNKLKKLLSKYDSCLIAFSGGVDSAFLLKVASLVIPKNKILGVTANSPTYPKEELVFAKRIARSFGVRHKVISTRELNNKKFIANSTQRCYFCKKELFTQLWSIAQKNNIKYIFDASNASDKSDFRPGNEAKKELKVLSPLQKVDLNKDEIRKLSRKLGLITWDKPALACLASRIPYGRRISTIILERINKAETYLRTIGFDHVRVRDYENLCRIEVGKKGIPDLIDKRKSIIDKLKKLGYNYITIDLEGYRTGSMNEGLIR